MTHKPIVHCLSVLSRFFFPVRIKGNNNKILYKGRLSRELIVRIKGDNNRIVIGEKLGIRGRCTITIVGNNSSIIIGENFRIHAGYMILAGDNSEIKISKDCAFRHPELVCMEDNANITIGENCLFAHHVMLRTSDAHSILDNISKKRLNHAKDIHIGDHVWLADNTTILKGVTVGNNSVVATRSLVTKDVPDNSIVAGVPAKVIKSNINWSNKLL